MGILAALACLFLLAIGLTCIVALALRFRGRPVDDWTAFSRADDLRNERANSNELTASRATFLAEDVRHALDELPGADRRFADAPVFHAPPSSRSNLG